MGRTATCTILIAAAVLAAGAATTAAQRAPVTVCVLDFDNQTRLGGDVLSRIAAAQVGLQLAESPNWEVVPRALVQRRIQDLELRPPFDRVDRARVAASLGAAAVVHGTIIEARVSRGAASRADVRMRIEVEEIRTEALIGGAVVDARTPPRQAGPGTEDELLEEAVVKAVYRARELMDRDRPPEGTVLATTAFGSPTAPNRDALINIGAQHGVRRGMVMIVTRQQEEVGRLRITSVDPNISTAKIIRNPEGVRSEDRVRAIFSPGSLPRSGDR